MDSDAARKEFDRVNDIRTLDPKERAVYQYDTGGQQVIRAAKPWRKE